MLQARGLQSILRTYNHDIPLRQPLIYLSQSPKELPIVIDTGASCSVTPTFADFLEKPTKPDTNKMEGLNGQCTEVVGAGRIKWDIEDANGNRDAIMTHAYFVPKANIRLFSPQVYVQEQQKQRNFNCNLLLNQNGIHLTLDNGNVLYFPLQQQSNLPIMLTHSALHPDVMQKGLNVKPHIRLFPRYNNLAKFLISSTFNAFNTSALLETKTVKVLPRQLDKSHAVMKQANWNLTGPQRELLLWHQKLGHINMDHVQRLLVEPTEQHRPAILKPKNKKSSSCQKPLCEVCQYAKQKRRSPPSTRHTSNKSTEGALFRDTLIPGRRTSVDLYQSSTRGRLPNTFGKEPEDQQYTGGAIFVDHATTFVHNTHQLSTTAAETIRSKHNFELFADTFGVSIKEYVGDNNPFHSKDWKDDCLHQNQLVTLSGVGAHHQNLAERYIQTIFNMARSMMLHFALHWPQAAQTNLWPFAVDHAVYLWNNTPKPNTYVSPLEHFTSTTFPDYNHLQRLHVFGCPVYVLDPKLQDGKKLPKWHRRSRQGIYVGISKRHSSTVHLVLNLDTGKVSPQYHVVFDDTFSTIFSNGQFNADVWTSLTRDSLDRHQDATDATDATSWFPSPSRSLTPTEGSSAPVHDSQPPTSHVRDVVEIQLPQEPLPSRVRNIQHAPLLSPTEGAPSVPEGVSSPLSLPSEGDRSNSSPQPQPLRRSTRITQPPTRLDPSFTQALTSSHFPNVHASRQVTFRPNTTLPRVSGERLNQQYLANMNWNRLLTVCNNLTGTLGAFIVNHLKDTSYNDLVEYLNPALFITLANKEDNPTYAEAMAGPDQAGFIKAMEIEIETLTSLEVYDLVKRTPHMKVLSSVWAFKRKRYPDGSIRKLKARFCARGFEQQEGVDYFETFAPVVMWITVRLLLIMSILMDLDTKQIDYTAAFVHAPIDCLVYVACPKGFEVTGKVWRLKKSLYGLAQSPRNFFLHTKNQLENQLGFTQSEADPCLFIASDVICLIYVDDALLFYKDATAVTRLTNKMDNLKIQFREEEDVAGFLGVHIERTGNEIHLTQKGLTERIIAAMHLNDSAVKPLETPAKGYLPIDEDGEPPLGMFSYPSVVGQLNYLQGHSRPDITMATSQVARFVHKPRRSHELALIQIGRYLKGTIDKGIILKPTDFQNFSIDVYVDAAFATGWGSEDSTNPDAVRSRTGYIIEVANCPVLWVSKLQSSIATSTMEAEYTALSVAMRAFIPLQAVVKSVISGLAYAKRQIITFKATVHEDNQGALILANLEPGRHTVRSKFYALRLHWFRKWVHNPESNITIQFVGTDLQKADFLTKALPAATLKVNRHLSMGW